VLRILVHAESVMFMAIAVALVVIAVVVFARGRHDLVLAPRGEQFAVTITPGGQQRAVHRGRPRAVPGHQDHLGDQGHPHGRRGTVTRR
jgi:hypothetical protein